MISARTREALAAKKEAGVKLGRPANEDIPLRKIALMRRAMYSWSAISRETGVSRTWLHNHQDDIEAELAEMAHEEGSGLAELVARTLDPLDKLQ